MTTDLFKETQNQPTDDTLPLENETATEYLDRLVGPGKKYKDVEALAQSRVFADEHISRLEQENRGFRQEVDDLKKNYETVTELLHDLRERQTNAQPTITDEPTITPEPREPTTASNELSREEITRIVREEFEEQERQGKVKKNLNEVYETLVSRFGSEEKANEVLNQKAVELAMPMQELEKLASTSPQAFERLVIGDIGRPTTAASLPRSSVNTMAQDTARNSNTQIGEEWSWSWAENVRKTDPARYNSAGFQVQLHQKTIEDPSRLKR